MKSSHPVLASSVLFLVLLAGGSALAQRVKGDITESQYDRGLKEVRESAFTPWMPVKDGFELMRRAELEGKLLLATERNSSGQIRSLLFFPPDGKGGDVSYQHDVTEEQLLERHAIWEKQNYNILFAVKNPSGNYTAIWIYSPRLGVAVKRLNEVGISAAVIRIKPGPTAEAAPAKAAVTTALRDWRDKSGRLLQASVEGINGGTVNFVRRDGVKFTYPLADLGAADQKYLADLQSKAATGSAAAASAAPAGFTDWMSRGEYDTEIARQMGNGMYAVFTENNSRRELRSLFEKRPETVRWFQALNESEQGLREKHASYQAQGYTLLSLSHERRTDLYCATWIYGIAPGEVSAQRGKFGITAPAINGKITVSTIPKR